MRGESTPFYLWDRDAHLRIRDAVPHAKLIAIIRDPVDRAYSNWTHLWSDGLEPEPDFRAAGRLESERVAAGFAPFWRYLELGRYGAQFQHLFEVFPREQVHVLRYRQLVEEPLRTLDAIFDFLGVKTGAVSAIPPSNLSGWADDGLGRASADRPSLNVDDRRELVEEFRADIGLREDLLDRDFQDWLGDSGRGTYAVRRS